MRLCPGVAEDHSERDHSPQPGLCHFDAFLHRVGRSARGAHAKAGLDHRRRLREDGVGDDAPDARGRRVAGRRLCRRRRPGRHRSAHRQFRMAQIFVAVLGASSFTFAKATWTQALPDWIDAHVRAFEASGGIPRVFTSTPAFGRNARHIDRSKYGRNAAICGRSGGGRNRHRTAPGCQL